MPGPELRSPPPHENPTYLALRHFWHPVAYSDEVTDKPVGTMLMGEKIVVARLGGEEVAMKDRCPHKGAALSLGRIVNCNIECPYHGWQFDHSGSCVSIPAREEMTSVMNRKVRKCHATESGGMIWVCRLRCTNSLGGFILRFRRGSRVI